eukprot:1089072-Amphidinium_carterae.1
MAQGTKPCFALYKAQSHLIVLSPQQRVCCDMGDLGPFIQTTATKQSSSALPKQKQKASVNRCRL